MKKYPTLAEMGVLHPGQIKNYSVNSINYVDTLRITYERPKGSVLPVYRTYKFPRVQRTVENGADAASGQTVMETNPGLSAALVELRELCGKRKHNKEIAESILDEIRQLEEDISMRGEYIKSLVGQIEADV